MSLFPPHPDSIHRDWLVIFEDVEPGAPRMWYTRWWMRRLRPGFRHVGCVRRTSGGSWLYVQSIERRLEVSEIPATAIEDVAEWKEAEGATVLRLVGWQRLPVMVWPEPLTCVVATKRLLGISAPWVQTPWQLYRLLTSSGSSRRGLTAGSCKPLSTVRRTAR